MIEAYRPMIEDLMNRLGVTEETATNYYYRCKRNGINPAEYDGKKIKGETDRVVGRVVKMDGPHGRKVGKRTTLSEEEQKAILIGIIMDAETKEVDKLRAMEMYRSVSGQDEGTRVGRYEIRIVDYGK